MNGKLSTCAVVAGIATFVAAIGEPTVVRAQAQCQPNLQFSGGEQYQANGQFFTRYKLAIVNWQAFPNEMFQWLGNGANPCRTHVTIRDENGKVLYEGKGHALRAPAQDLYRSDLRVRQPAVRG